ncbi:hypothetical protein [Luteipulveratus flavus]|uniref:Uncharacterized protein n=1 Tax=Luteipulveratus flavus TaxID=3031728 RepID=A0ABT6C291_9MICO|nr:hypothetical protein [Luteipulveratus sp. YIM 133296]MDF8262633.1 hypothetical protein [Luteipulveratus sp. YIM 133296]
MTQTSGSSVTVTTAAELADALEADASDIVVQGTISGSPSITLPEGATLRGGELAFLGKGVRLTRDNTLRDITITTMPHEVAVYNDTSVPDAGTFRFENVSTVGQVYLVAEARTTSVRVETMGLHVKEADVRGRVEQPHGYGVDVLQGGLTLWNRQPDASARFTATLRDVSVGTEQTPVRGSGVFVAGYGDREGKAAGGFFEADLIETGAVVTDGGIAPGTPDKITGGVFVVSGAKVEKVLNAGAVTTHGQNDMVLDNWGEVDQWVATAQVTSTGPSGIGFVNFGDITTLDVQAPIVTTGAGARGFNLYDGTLKDAAFHSIRTTGDGSIGVQVSKPLGALTVHHDVETTGGEGMSLVKGVQMTLKAIAFSVKEGGAVGSVTIGGAMRTRGDDVVTFEVADGGSIEELTVGGGIAAQGAGSRAVRLDGTVPSLDGIAVTDGAGGAH